jgi:hypothetical protein
VETAASMEAASASVQGPAAAAGSAAIRDPIRGKAARPDMLVLVIAFSHREFHQRSCSPTNAVNRKEFPTREGVWGDGDGRPRKRPEMVETVWVRMCQKGGPSVSEGIG